MRPTPLRVPLIVAGVAVTVWSVLQFRLADWPIYVAYALLSVVLFRFYVEVLPSLVLPVPGLALTIGFLYVGGPPVIALRLAEPILATFLRAVVPGGWRDRFVGGSVGGAGAVASLFWIKEWNGRAAAAAEWASFSLGLGVRWWVVSRLVPGAEPTRHPGAIALAELAGYVVWGILATLPIYSYRPFLPPAPAWRRLRTAALQDLEVIFMMTLTPLVFLIVYGYTAHGLVGAAAWSLSAIGLHVVLKRLTERRVSVEEQNRRLEALNRELEHRERLSAIGKMSSVISHQMLQQLGVIGIHADLIRHADGDPAAAGVQAKANAAAIEDALGAVNRVLEDLLVFSRDLRLNLYEHRLADVLGECVDECRPQAAERAVALRLECPTEGTARLDKLKIKQAVVNVLRNAIEVSPTASEVVLRGRLADGAAEIAVADRGAGIAASDRAAVFTPFFTTKPQGSGLGLAIARQFAEAHGGTITADDRDGGGTTFVLRLPRDGPPAPRGAS
jgi:signal transduction histidine kinase